MKTVHNLDEATASKRLKVFICYTKKDAAKARELYDELNAAGADPWLDGWEQEIKKAVAQADAFVACLRRAFDEIGFRQRLGT